MVDERCERERAIRAAKRVMDAAVVLLEAGDAEALETLAAEAELRLASRPAALGWADRIKVVDSGS